MTGSKSVLVVSLRFNPGHVSHLVAFYRLFEDLGYIPSYYVTRQFIDYLPCGSRILEYGKDIVKNCDLAIFLFPAKANLTVIFRLKNKCKSKIVYLFHEPLASMKTFKEAGFSYWYLIRLWLINIISALTVNWSDIILLPSKKAVNQYKSNTLYKKSNYYYLPLLFDDERTAKHLKLDRQFFSYIGTVAADHSFDEFIQFVEKAVTGGLIPQMKFLIATKSDFEVPPALIDSPRVIIRKGKPLSNDDINEFYATTCVVWNAYDRTTQSGVLAKSFMFGTPAIVLRKNLSEFTVDRNEVFAIDDNTSCEEIEEAILCITRNFEHYSSAARKRFDETFYYRSYNERIKSIIG